MTKGIELPINILVIVAVAVIVLLGIVALFMIGFAPFSQVSGQESYKNAACSELVRGGCTDSAKNIQVCGFDANKDGNAGAAYCGVQTDFTWDDTTTSAENEAKDIIANNKDSLASLCVFYYGRYSETDCKRLCSCPGY